MNESKKLFVNQLLTVDPTSADARQRYEREMRAMFEKTLTRGERREYLVTAILMGLIGLGLAVVCSLNVLIEWPSRPMHARDDIKFVLVFFLLTAIVLLVVAAISFRAYWKGIISRRTSNDWAAGAGVAYVGGLGCLFLLMARHIPEMLQAEVRLLGLVLLMFAGVAWVRHSVARAEMRTAEKLLEIELRLAEIGEALEAPPRSADGTIAQPPPPA
jgi:hypothetical protein